jgi:hypothetical protein
MYGSSASFTIFEAIYSPQAVALFLLCSKILLKYILKLIFRNLRAVVAYG